MAISEFVDGTTPLDASHLNALVGGVNDLTSAFVPIEADYAESIETTANTLTKINYSVVIPAQSLVCIHARLSWSSGQPVALAISSSDSSSGSAYWLSYGEDSSGYPHVNFTRYYSSATTLYFYGSWVSATPRARLLVYGAYIKNIN